MTLMHAALVVLVTSGGALPFLMRLLRRRQGAQLPEALPAPVRKEIAEDLPTIIQVLGATPALDAISDHIHAGVGARPILHVDLTDAGPQSYYELGNTTTTGATPDAALRKLAAKVAAVLSQAEAPVDADVQALATDGSVTSPVADQPGGDVQQ